MKNILKEIKENFICKGGEYPVNDLEIFISENKIFNILFYSTNISLSNDYSLNNYENFLSKYNQNKEIKVIICICDDNEEDYNKSINKFSNISCLIIPFNSKISDLLINSFNIISLPRLIVLDKEGKKLDALNNKQIININEDIFNKWINLYKIKTLYKAKEPQIGDRLYVSKHEHELVFVDYLQKSPGYSYGWRCNICNTSFPAKTANFYCADCHFDICDKCLPKYRIDI